jgi:6-phosphofructokinase 1
MAKQASKLPVGNMVIGQSGGPTVVINQSLIGAVLEAQKHRKTIKKIYGALHGVQGILKQDLIDLTNEPKANLLKVGMTPASALGSVRKKPTADECKAMFEVLKAHDVRYFFYVGGNDSAETAHIVHEVAVAEGYDLRVFHIPKTIDNDLLGTDHCPGFGSAAKFVAQAFMGDDMDNRSLKGIKINIIMGRHAGFLTAAAALGRARADSGPHLVYLPEVAFDEKKFVADVKKVYAKHGRCMVAVSEGIADKNHTAIASKFIKEVDSHGNVQLSGSGALGDFLTKTIKDGFGDPKLRVRADTFGYLQRSFAGVVSKVDADEARKVGELAVRHAVGGAASGTISMIRVKGKAYKIDYKLSPLSLVAKNTCSVPAKYINKDGNNVTQAFVNYALPLVGELPPIGFLKGKKVAKVKIKAKTK